MLESKILILDTSIWLWLYSYNHNVTKDIIENLKKETDKIWVPHQVYLEFINNIKKGDGKYFKENAIKQYNQLIDKINGQLRDSDKKIKGILSTYTHRDFPELRNLKKEFKKNFKSGKKIIEDYNKNIQEHITANKNLHKQDPVKGLMEQLKDLNKIGSKYTISKLYEIYEEAEKRYTYMLPPGYMDDKRYNNDGKDSPDKYGDYLVWKQMIDKSLTEGKDIIYVTNDHKPDWMEGETLRADLVDEFKELTNGKKIIYLSFNDLKEKELGIYLNSLEEIRENLKKYIDEEEIQSWVEDIINDDINIILNKLEKNKILNMPVDVEDSEINFDNFGITNLKLIGSEDGGIKFILDAELTFDCELNYYFDMSISLKPKINIIYDKYSNSKNEVQIEIRELNFEEINDLCITPSVNNGETCINCGKFEGILDCASGGYICEECESNFIKCEECERLFFNDCDEIYTYDEFAICEECIEYRNFLNRK